MTKNIFKQEARNALVEIHLLSILQIFFDDSTRNIASAKAAGLHTVIVRRHTRSKFHINNHHLYSNGIFNDKTFWILQVGRSSLVPGADHALESIHNIKQALPEIWDGQDRSESDVVLASSAVGTAVVAWMCHTMRYPSCNTMFGQWTQKVRLSFIDEGVTNLQS